MNHPRASCPSTPQAVPHTPTPASPLRASHRRVTVAALGVFLAAASLLTFADPAPTAATQAPARPGSRPGQAIAPAALVLPVQRLQPDYAGIGGTVYATGLGPVTVTMHPMSEFLSDGFHAYSTTVHARIAGNERLLGVNTRKSKVQLGNLPRGEIRLVARSEGGDGTFESGAANRNPDGFPHSRVREVRPGIVEVYFENTRIEGTRNDGVEQHWYKDVKLTFTGAVTADPGMLTLLEKSFDPDPATRDAARQALRLASPAMARAAGIR